MKTALSLILAALTTTATAAAPAANAIENKTETRTVSGVVYAIDYPTDDRDYAITTIETEDGNLWDVEDYVAPRNAKVAVTFDTMGTETILDDEIVQIVTVWNA